MSKTYCELEQQLAEARIKNLNEREARDNLEQQLAEVREECAIAIDELTTLNTHFFIFSCTAAARLQAKLAKEREG